MWALHNQTSFAADRAIVLDKDGARHWVVVVKGTFDLDPRGKVTPAKEQLAPLAAPEYAGKNGASSLRYEADLVAAKPRTDVYLNATAHAPGGRPTTSMNVGLETPLGTKAIAVTGDRRWERSLTGNLEPSRPLPFAIMPIVYERAFGGYDTLDPDPRKHTLYDRNPVGTGLASLRAQPGVLLPNLELPGRSPEAEPAGYGALCGHWQPRARFWGTYDAGWMEKRKPLLAVDYDPQALQCAPADQQVGPHLNGGEAFGVVNLTPSGSLGFALPKHYFGFTTVIGRSRHEHRAKISTVVIEPDFPRVIVVWHTSLACHRQIDDIDYTEIVEKPYV